MERNLKNWKNLQLAATQIQVSNSNSKEQQPLSNDDKQWLENVFKDVTGDLTGEMKAAIDIIECSEQNENKIAALDALLNIVDDINFAQDDNVCAKTAELIGELAQNNSYCQFQLSKLKILKELFNLLESDRIELVKEKALFAISCILRSNDAAHEELELLDGYRILLYVLQNPGSKLYIKCCFLISMLCKTNIRVQETLLKMGFLDFFISILQEEHQSCHEYLVSALLTFVQNSEEALDYCRKNTYRIFPLIIDRIEILSHHEEFEEEIQFLNQLMKLLSQEDSGHEY